MSSVSSAAKEWFRENAGRFSGQLLFDEPLSRHTYYRIGGPAAVLVSPSTLEDLKWVAEGIRETGIRHYVLGAGSNVLVGDGGVDCLVVRANRVNLEISLLSPSRVRTGASVALSSLLRRAAAEGWGGLEFLAGIHGSVGGAVAMNAGTHLGESKDRLVQVEVVPLVGALAGKDSKPVIYGPDELKFEYRRNLFVPSGGLVWAAEWRIDQAEPAQVKALINELLARRKSTQPVNLPSCGSVFKNPKQSGLSAWQVIDKLGLRGHTVGRAQFSEKHSNFIVNLGGASAADVLALIRLAKTRAESELGVRLEEEVVLLGDHNRDQSSL